MIYQDHVCHACCKVLMMNDEVRDSGAKGEEGRGKATRIWPRGGTEGWEDLVETNQVT